MLNILKAAPGDEVLRRLYHGDKVFHDVLAWVAGGDNSVEFKPTICYHRTVNMRLK